MSEPSEMSAGSQPREGRAALTELASILRRNPALAAAVREPSGDPGLGMLAAAGPRASAARPEYAKVVEAVREGYLIHYGHARLLDEHDPDLALLAGDYLYALGLDSLASLGDPDAVVELTDLISLAARLHAGPDDPPELAPEALWLATATAIAAGSTDAHKTAKAALRDGATGAAGSLVAEAARVAVVAGITTDLGVGAESIGFPVEELPDFD